MVARLQSVAALMAVQDMPLLGIPVHLHRKLGRTLAMLLRLKDLRRGMITVDPFGKNREPVCSEGG
jgi:hypothetical protein